MNQAIKRFITRLTLPYGMSFKLINCTVNMNDELYQKFERKLLAISGGGPFPIIQLYHALRTDDVSVSICNHGFKLGHFGNKGPGVYLANHSRYSMCWAPYNPVIICDVIADTKYVKRYRSEIYSPEWSSEYVIGDPSLIYPRYVLQYDIEGEISPTMRGRMGYVRHGEFGCQSCDYMVFGNKRGTRCDCQLTPTIDVRDQIRTMCQDNI